MCGNPVYHESNHVNRVGFEGADPEGGQGLSLSLC